MKIPPSEDMLRSLQCNMHYSKIEQRIEGFERLLTFIVSSVQAERNFHKKYYEEFAKECGNEIPEGADNIEDDKYQSNYLTEEVFVKTLLNSYVVTLHSFVEAELTAICDFFSKNYSTECASFAKPQNGGVLDRAKEYLAKEVKLDTNKLFGQFEWCEIRKFSGIRNCIVHNEGYIPKVGYEKLCDYVQRSKHLCVSEQRQIILKDVYCTFITKQVLAFFKKNADAQKKVIASKRP